MKTCSTIYRKWSLVVMVWIAVTCVADIKAQVIINEITSDGRVELLNTGDQPVDVSDFWLVNFPTYLRLDNANVLCDSLVMMPGAFLALDSVDLDGEDGELALFRDQNFTNAFFLEDYVEWGSASHFTASLAIEADEWSVGDFVFRFDSREGIEYRGSGNASGDWLADGTSSICQPNDIDMVACLAEPAEIVSTGNTVQCVDGVADLVSVISSGGSGDSTQYVITDRNNRVLMRNVTWPMDFGQFVAGTYYIRQLNYSGELSGLAVNFNLGNVAGCVVSSNIIVIEREVADGGLIISQVGSSTIQGCGGLVVPLDHLSGASNLPYHYVLVDQASNQVILSQDARSDSLLTITDPQATTYQIYGLSGNIGSVPPGAQLDALASQPCIDISNNSIRVIIIDNTTQAAEITPADSLVYCVADNKPEVQVDTVGAEAGDQQRWVLATDQGEILDVTEEGSLNVDSLSMGIYSVYRISYDMGLVGLEIGGDLAGLQGCFDLSDPRQVIIEQADAGQPILENGNTSATFCAGSARVNITTTEASEFLPYYFIAADESNDSIVAVIPRVDSMQTLDLSHLDAGECRIYGYAQSGDLQVEPGMKLDDLVLGPCAALSSESVLIEKTPNPYRGGRIATRDELVYCIDSTPDIVQVILSFAVADSSEYIVTDQEGVIVATGLGASIELDEMQAGVRRIYHLSYGEDLTGLVIGNNIDELRGCHALSNPIEVRRDFVDGGRVATGDSIAVASACSGGFFIQLEHQSLSTLLPYHYLVVESPNQIVAVLDPADGPVYDLSYLPVDNYEVYGWSHASADPLPVGAILDMASDGDCEALSTNSIPITILPNVSEGGVLTTQDDQTICIDSLPDLVDLQLQNADGVVRINFVIIDEDFNIIDVPDSNPPYDLDDGQQGSVFIYNMAHNGAIGGLVPGNSIAQVRGCYDLSNRLEVVKVVPDAGEVTTALGESRVSSCAGDIVVEMQHSAVQSDLGYSYVVTDDMGLILDVFDESLTSSVIIQGNNPGICRIYGWSYDDVVANVEGLLISDLSAFNCSAVSSSFVTVEKIGSQTEGGVVTGTNVQTFCSDGIADPIEVSVTGQLGSNSDWIVVDESGMIVSLPFAPPFNLDPAGAGEFTIYHISYEDGLEGLSVFSNIADLRGCYDLSNPLLVTNVTASAGDITTSDEVDICLGAGQEVIDFIATSPGIGISLWIVVDGAGVIQLVTNNSQIDFSDFGPGRSSVRRLSYIGSIEGLEEGVLLENLEGCFDLSNQIMVTRTIAQAGNIQLSDGTRTAVLCTGEGQVDLTHSVPNDGQAYRVVVTDANDDILRVEAMTNTVDLSDLPAGKYKLFGWSSGDGITPTIGQNIGTLDQGCSDVTNQFVEVDIVDVDGSSVVSTSGPTIVSCLDGVPDPIQLFTTSNATALPYSYLITDLNGIVLQVVTGTSIDLESSTVPVSRIYGYSHSESNRPSPGDNVNVLNTNSCGDLSENFITVTKQAADGGTIISELGNDFTICVDQEADAVLFTANTASTSLQYTFVVTDDNNIITHTFNTALIDFNQLGVGLRRVFGWSHDPATMAQIGSDVGSLDQPCGDLSSNFIVVNAVDTGSPCTTSSEEVDDAREIQLYPNPSSGDIFIKGLEPASIEVATAVSIAGQRFEVPVAMNRIDGRGLAPGYYILEMQVGAVLVRRPIIVSGR